MFDRNNEYVNNDSVFAVKDSPMIDLSRRRREPTRNTLWTTTSVCTRLHLIAGRCRMMSKKGRPGC